MRRDLILPGLATAAFAAASVAVAAADPASVILSFHKSVVAAAKARTGEAEAERAVRRSFDIDAIVTSVLAAHAGAASRAQRARLGDLIVHRLAERVLKDPDVRAGAPLAVVKTRPVSDGVWLISTRTQGPDGSFSLTWRLRESIGGPRVVDVLHDGVSMEATERRKLEAALQGRDLDAALAEVEGRKASGGR